MAFNVALYTPDGNVWAMTERGEASLSRTTDSLTIGRSSMELRDGKLLIRFDETALPWPGQRLWPKAFAGAIEITPKATCEDLCPLDRAGHHCWSPRIPTASAVITSDALPGGGWHGPAYHDMNYGDRPIEQDFVSWDWARGSGERDDATVILYDAVMQTGERRRLALRTSGKGELTEFSMPERQALPGAFWGVKSGIACDPQHKPRLIQPLEDTPFYTRSLVDTVVSGQALTMVHETLDCRRLANPLVRLMLPFRMPRRSGWQA
ncbi:carotenoid 1,2-hydratase [Rhizobium sp. RU36D]|uniref:carotenoid 1,2-hydratase n=1 Tax=Rhizobium sp. RU36D TaxID=1907415 RepID=UPI001FCCC9F2|nr:carotenoid 1,2-hydratase [Rhizobium sp. RU36D]